MASDPLLQDDPPLRNLSAAETHAFDSLIGHALHTGVHRDDLEEFLRSSIEMWEQQLGLR